MISVNMHEAKSRLSELVKVVETTGESVVLCRNGSQVAEIRPIKPRRKAKIDRLKPHPELKATLVPGYDPTEPLQADELPDWMQ